MMLKIAIVGLVIMSNIHSTSLPPTSASQDACVTRSPLRSVRRAWRAEASPALPVWEPQQAKAVEAVSSSLPVYHRLPRRGLKRHLVVAAVGVRERARPLCGRRGCVEDGCAPRDRVRWPGVNFSSLSRSPVHSNRENSVEFIIRRRRRGGGERPE